MVQRHFGPQTTRGELVPSFVHPPLFFSLSLLAFTSRSSFPSLSLSPRVLRLALVHLCPHTKHAAFLRRCLAFSFCFAVIQPSACGFAFTFCFIFFTLTDPHCPLVHSLSLDVPRRPRSDKLPVWVSSLGWGQPAHAKIIGAPSLAHCPCKCLGIPSKM